MEFRSASTSYCFNSSATGAQCTSASKLPANAVSSAGTSGHEIASHPGGKRLFVPGESSTALRRQFLHGYPRPKGCECQSVQPFRIDPAPRAPPRRPRTPRGRTGRLGRPPISRRRRTPRTPRPRTATRNGSRRAPSRNRTASSATRIWTGSRRTSPDPPAFGWEARAARSTAREGRARRSTRPPSGLPSDPQHICLRAQESEVT